MHTRSLSVTENCLTFLTTSKLFVSRNRILYMKSTAKAVLVKVNACGWRGSNRRLHREKENLTLTNARGWRGSNSRLHREKENLTLTKIYVQSYTVGWSDAVFRELFKMFHIITQINFLSNLFNL